MSTTSRTATPIPSSPSPPSPLVLPALSNDLTLRSLLHRLERLEFLLTGHTHIPTDPPSLVCSATNEPILQTLKELRHEFALLVSESRAMSDLIKLRPSLPTRNLPSLPLHSNPHRSNN